MRIISGKYSGRKLKASIPDNIRPTLDSVKETVFNILENLVDFREVNVLDLYAGTGSLGFESLSRGAKYCEFVDSYYKSAKILKKFAEDIQADKIQFKISKMDVRDFIQITDKKFDIIFADPPYKASELHSIVDNMIKHKLFNDNAIFVLETSNFKIIPENEKLKFIREKISGDTKVTFFRYQTDE